VDKLGLGGASNSIHDLCTGDEALGSAFAKRGLSKQQIDSKEEISFYPRPVVDLITSFRNMTR
jgi:hypothetical protein